MAARIKENPALRDVALATLDRWMARPSRSTPYLQHWRNLLQGDLPTLLATMRSSTEEAIALRQCTPFGGTPFISHRERFQIIRKYASNRA